MGFLHSLFGGLCPPFSKISDEPSNESQDRLALPPGSETSRRDVGDAGTVDTARSEELTRLRKEVETLTGQVERQGVDIVRLKEEEERLTKVCKQREDQIAELQRQVEQTRAAYQEDLRKRTQHIRATEERLKLTEELLATRSAELSGAHAFLSTTDDLSETEVLGIIRDLNENIYQVAVNLTEEWEKFESPQVTTQTDIDPTSEPLPALVQLVRNRNPMGLNFLLQSCLCSQVVMMTSSWGRHKELAMLEPVYERLSASEGQAISARWRSLTHNYLALPPPDPAPLVEQLAGILDETGSFSSTQQSLELVKGVALEGIEAIIRLALRSELAFMVEVKSSDMTLLVEAPGTVFDDARMTDEYESGAATTSEQQDKVAATTEVGVGKRIPGGPGEGRRVEVMLKTKVVLEKDVVEGGVEAVEDTA